MAEKKSRIIYIQKYLFEHTDEDHPATVTDIMDYLSREGIPATRKTLTHDIEQIIEAGIDVVCNKSRRNQYFIGERHFESPELKLLIDAAQASRFLTAKRSRALIGKLLALTSHHQAESFASAPYLEQIKQKNEKAYITADLLLTAINTKRRVQFKYFEYTPAKKKVYKHGQRVYELSPWVFVWSDDSYYIIGQSETHGNAAKFRVDRIAAPKLTDKPVVPAPEDFDLALYMQSLFHMFDGSMLDVTLKCKNEMMKTIVDRFGEDVQTDIADPEHFYAKVRVSASKAFYGWIFGMDGAIKVEAPAEAVNAYQTMLERAQRIIAGKSLYHAII
jgi:predicted DNA-binding transcriptional regulator YafY